MIQVLLTERIVLSGAALPDQKHLLHILTFLCIRGFLIVSERSLSLATFAVFVSFSTVPFQEELENII